MKQRFPDKKVFFKQTLLNRLSDEGKISLDRNLLTILSTDRPSFFLEPAYRLIKTADGSADPHGVVGQIRSEKEIKDMDAEIYLESVIIGDTAYEAESGFIGEEKEVMEKLSDTDLLARFLLDEMK